jgi:formylglycine-generating enzyme required for sulfatase activity
VPLAPPLGSRVRAAGRSLLRGFAAAGRGLDGLLRRLVGAENDLLRYFLWAVLPVLLLGAVWLGAIALWPASSPPPDPGRHLTPSIEETAVDLGGGVPPAPAAEGPPADDDRWTPWQDIFDGKTLDGWRQPSGDLFRGGNADVQEHCMILQAEALGAGIVATRPVPTINYEVAIEAKRVTGWDFGSTTFPIGHQVCTFYLGGNPNGDTVGLGRLDGLSYDNNATASRIEFQADRWYKIRLRVTAERIWAWIDDAEVVNVAVREHEFRTDHPGMAPFGLYAWNGKAAIRSIRLRQLKAAATDASRVPPEPGDEPRLPESAARPKEIGIDLDGGVKLEMVLIPAGSFMMGSNLGHNEKPVHKVRITRPFYLGKYLVTQEQWEAVMDSNPSRCKGPKNPVELVSWDDCQQFFDKLNAKSGPGGGKFQLPTEARWEYACQAGSTTRYCFGDDESGLGEYAWYSGNSGGKTHPVGEKKPNAWGLYDMHGNVCQWCADWYDAAYYAGSPTDDPTGPETGSARVIHGCCWYSYAPDCRSANRYFEPPGGRRDNVGFRVSRVAVDEEPAGEDAPPPGPSRPQPDVKPQVSGEIGEFDVPYKIGDWTLLHHKTYGQEWVHLWHLNGDAAVELNGSSNGWWRLARDGKEGDVYPPGNKGGGTLSVHPWQTNHAQAEQVAPPAAFEMSGPNGVTSFQVTDKEISITFDVSVNKGGTIVIDPHRADVRYTNPQGKATSF